MIDPATTEQLAKLRRQINIARQTCGQTLDAMTHARRRMQTPGEVSPFLDACARDLEALAGVCRLAAEEGGADRARD